MRHATSARRLHGALAALALALAASRASAQPAHAAIDAYDAIARDGRLFVLEPDQRAVTAYALPARTVAWHQPLPDAATASSQLTALEPGRLLVWNAGRLYVVARATGALVEQRTSLAAERPFLVQRGDACGLNATCAFQPIDCADARPLGTVVRGAQAGIELHGAASAGCYGFERLPIGATSAVSSFVFARTATDAAPAVVGIDRATGAMRYRRESTACASCSPTGAGALPALDLCWTADQNGAIDVRAFACSTGAPRWSWHAAGGSASHVVTSTLEAGAPAVLISAVGTAALLDARTGAVRWTRAIPGDALATVAGQRSDAALISLFGYGALITLDAATGATRATSARGRVAWQPDGTFRVSDLETPGETGGPSAPFPAHDPVLRVDRAAGDGPARVRVRATGATALTLAHDGWWIGEATDGHDVVGAVYERATGASGRVRFVRVAGAAGRAR